MVAHGSEIFIKGTVMLVSVRKVLESYESPVIQDVPDSRRVTDVDEQERARYDRSKLRYRAI